MSYRVHGQKPPEYDKTLNYLVTFFWSQSIEFLPKLSRWKLWVLQSCLRAGIITYVSRRDELHVIKNLATLGERRLSGRLPCRRLKHRVREEKTVLQPDAGWELAGSHRFVLLAARCRLGASWIIKLALSRGNSAGQKTVKGLLGTHKFHRIYIIFFC